MRTIHLWGSDFIESNEVKICSICGKPTKWIEIYYEAPYCSKECLNIEDKRYIAWCMKSEEGEF